MQVTETQALEFSKEKIEVETVNSRVLSANYLYPSGDWDNELPGVIVFHGYSGSKEMMWPLGKLLARNGFAVLIVDLQGHGHSTGILREDGNDSLSNDGLAAVAHLRTKPEVDPSLIGLAGHSMGAGTAIATSFRDPSIKANVLIGNDLDGNSTRSQLNSNNPQNMLMLMGNWDELFDLQSCYDSMSQALDRTVAATDIESGKLYGDFVDGTARQLNFANTNHLFEVLNPQFMEDTVRWMEQALGNNVATGMEDASGADLVLTEFVKILISLLWFAWIILAMITLFRHFSIEEPAGEKRFGWLIHGLLITASFMVGAIMGLFVLGDFVAIFASWYIFGSIAYLILFRKDFRDQMANFKKLILPVSIGIGITLFVFFFNELWLAFTPWDFRYVVPILSNIALHRIPAFLFLWLLGSIYFMLEIRYSPADGNSLASDFIRTYAGRTWIFILILMAQYIPVIFFGSSILPGMVGFLAFFILSLVPIMLVITTISAVGTRYRIPAISMAIIVAGYISWILIATLPFQ